MYYIAALNKRETIIPL